MGGYLMAGVGLDRLLEQQEFADLVGISQPAVSELVSKGILLRNDTGSAWLLAYCKRLRDQAAGRDGDSVLTQERAKLARAQTQAVEMKNALARGEYAPVAVIAELFAIASQAVADRFETLTSMLGRVCPDLPPAARDAIEQLHVEARNEWVRSTATFVASRVVDEEDDESDDDADQALDAGELSELGDLRLDPAP